MIHTPAGVRPGRLELGAPVAPTAVVSPGADLPEGLLLSGITAATDAVICVSPDRQIVLCNPAAERLFSFAATEVLGQSLDILFPHAALELRDSAELPPLPTAVAWQEHTLTGVRRDGSSFRTLVRVMPASSSGGTFLTLAFRAPAEEDRAFAELSLLKSMALAIGTSEDLRTALELTLQQIGTFTGWTAGESWLPHAAGQVLRRGPVWSRLEAPFQEFHHASETMAFRRSEGLPGRTWESGSAIWIDDVTTHADFVRTELAEGCGLHAGFAIPVLAGTEVVAVIVFYHTDVRAQDAGLVDLIAAVTAQLGSLIQRKRAEDALLVHAQELARSNAELEQFAYVASHDLQEPLRMVASYTQLLERRYRDRLDDDAREFIGFAVEGVTRMKQLILDLLAFSRVKTRSEPFQPVDLDAVLNGVMLDFASAEDQVEGFVTADPLPRLCVDERQFSQVFQNLIGNALKFRGEQTPRIHVSADRQGEEWVFACRDNGIGIAAEYFERIFMVFQRLHSRTDYPGNGIGLAICKKIIERHGGRIWVESVPGAGSTFYFTLPADAEGEEPARPLP